LRKGCWKGLGENGRVLESMGSLAGIYLPPPPIILEGRGVSTIGLVGTGVSVLVLSEDAGGARRLLLSCAAKLRC
jgi:hypothetical protein